ncbi:HAD-IB family phosphatase [Litorimonas sp. RW-G-Af-16]|uniref:HAD-IB family phosphatase n=1 Tax=Litorimonas sp. RW-G-Af-16 TaxID=3241168 RepID=UPI00390C8907
MTQPPPKSLIVFDFDGTITTRDTFAMFLRYYAGPVRWFGKIMRLLPTFISYKLGLIDRHAVKKAVIKRFFAGESEAQMTARAQQFAAEVIPDLIRPGAHARLSEILSGPNAAPESLYICSASIAPYLKAWASSYSIHESHVLAVELQTEDGRLTGDISGYNIWGANKVRRIYDEFAPHSVVIEEAYGDTRGDKELLHAAKASFFRPFRV